MRTLDGELFKLVVLLENAETRYGVLFCWLVRRTFCFGHHGMGWGGTMLMNDAGGRRGFG